jgi:hypothetical protein
MGRLPQKKKMINIRSSGKAVWRLGVSLALASCTATEQSAETNAASRAPSEVRTDADRRAIYENGRNTNTSPVPDATPNTQRLGEQASDINRRKRIESINTNDPNTTTPETRVQRQTDIPSAAPVPQ